MYTNILVAFDHSESGQKALESAANLMNLEQQASMTIAHVSTDTGRKNTAVFDQERAAPPIMSPGIERSNPAYMPPQPSNDAHYQHHSDALNEALLTAKEFMDQQGIEADFHPLTGDPAEAIVEYAAASQVDLIIVGRTEKSTFQKWFLGSVSEKIVQEALCHVLVVK